MVCQLDNRPRMGRSAQSLMYETPQYLISKETLLNYSKERSRSACRTSSDNFRCYCERSRVIIAVITPFEKLYYKTVDDVMRLIRDFLERTSLTSTELGGLARVELEAFADRLLGQLPDAGFPQDAARIRGEYRERFRQRLEGALRDIQIGFIAGRKIATAHAQNTEAEATTAKLGDAVILKPMLWGMGIDLPKAWKWVQDKWRHTRDR
jgi:hypothetical protein